MTSTLFELFAALAQLLRSIRATGSENPFAAELYVDRSILLCRYALPTILPNRKESLGSNWGSALLRMRDTQEG